MKADANEQVQAIFDALPPRPNTIPAPTTEAPLPSWRDQPTRTAIHERLAEARAAFPKLIDLATDTERQHAAAIAHRKETHIGTLVGKATAADLKRAEVAREAREKDAAVAADRRDDCGEAITALEAEIPRLEQEAKLEAFKAQCAAYFTEIDRVAHAAVALFEAATRAKRWRDHLETEYHGTPEGSRGTPVRDAHGHALLDGEGNPVYLNDGPAPRVMLPNADASLLGLGSIFATTVTEGKLESLRASAKQHGCPLTI